MRELSEEAKKHLRPRRKLTGLFVIDKDVEIDAKATAKWIAKAYPNKKEKYAAKTNEALFAAGLKKKPNVLAKERAAAHALLKDFSIEKVAAPTTSIETLAVAERMVWQMGFRRSLTPAIASARGLLDAALVVASAAMLTTSSEAGYTTEIHIVPSDDAKGWFAGGEPCPALRHLVCAASRAEYDAAVKAIAKATKGKPFATRAAMAFVFPDEDWGAKALEEALLPANVAAYPAYHHRGVPHYLLSTIDDSELLRSWMSAHGVPNVTAYAVDLALSLPPKEAVPIFAEAIAALLVKPKHGPLHKTPPRLMALGLTCIDSKEAADVLAPYANNAILGPMVLAYFRDHKDKGAVLAATAKGKSRLETTAARVLGSSCKHDAAVKVAKASDLPSLFVDRPWRVKASKDGEVEIFKGLAMLGLEKEKVKVVRPSQPWTPFGTVRDATKAEVEAWRKKADKDEFFMADFEDERKGGWQGPVTHLRIPDKEMLWGWNERRGHMHGDVISLVEKFGLKMLPGLLLPKREWVAWLAWEGHQAYFDAACSLISPRIAPKIAEVAFRRKAFRRLANAWLAEHVEVAAYGLIHAALSEGDAAAEKAIVMLARHHGHDAVLRKIAAKYGKEAKRVIDQRLDRDPLSFRGSVPKRPSFLRVDELPPPLLLNKKPLALPPEAIEGIVDMLSISTLDDPYAGLEIVKKECTPESLGDFATELLEQWVMGDAGGRTEWMLFGTVHFPSEKGSRRVAELAREWARKNQAKAERACVALAEIGTDFALMHLGHIAETTRFAELRKKTAALLSEAAKERGLTEEELGDRTVPDAGLGSDGTLRLSFGATRAFVVSCDASLKPVVREVVDPDNTTTLGPPQTSLPRAVKTDDAALAKQAREKFDELKKDLRAVAQRQVRRLERAMVQGRTWSIEEFEECIAKHPLLSHLARGLVFEIDGATSFRIAEDGTWSDASDSAIKKLGRTIRIRIAHPARTPTLAKDWGTIFGDYELLQPFEQLSRAVVTPTASEKKEKALTRAAKLTVSPRKLLGTMESRGWRRNDTGYVSAWLRTVSSAKGESLQARWPIAPGIAMEDIAHAPDVTTDALLLVFEDGDGGKESLAMSALDRTWFSEIVRDIEAVRLLTAG